MANQAMVPGSSIWPPSPGLHADPRRGGQLGRETTGLAAVRDRDVRGAGSRVVNDAPEDPAAYLGRLATRLHGPPDHVRRLIDETAARLDHALAEAVAAGTDPVTARREALGRFGAVDVVARAMNRATWARYRRPAVREAATTVTALAAAGVLAMGWLPCWRVMHRRERVRTELVPPGVGPALARVAFGLGAVGTGLFAQGDAVVLSIWGAGLFWVAAATCALATAASGVLLLRVRGLRHIHPATQPRSHAAMSRASSGARRHAPTGWRYASFTLVGAVLGILGARYVFVGSA